MKIKRVGKWKGITISWEINKGEKSSKKCWKWVDDVSANVAQQEHNNNKRYVQLLDIYKYRLWIKYCLHS